MARLIAGLLLRAVGLLVDVVLLGIAIRAGGVAGILVLTLVVWALRLGEASVVVRARRSLIAAVPNRVLPDRRVPTIVAELCQRANRPQPVVRCVERIGSDRFNAAAVPGPDGGLCFITPGTVSSLTDGELRAVLAHELAHLWRPYSRWSVPLTVLGSLTGILVYQVGLAVALWGTALNVSGAVASPLLVAVVIVLVPYLTQAAARIPARREEFRADAMSVSLGADPTELAFALFELEIKSVDVFRQRHHLPPLHPDDRPTARAHFTSQERRVIVEGLCHPHSSVLRTLIVGLSATGTHPSLRRRARRLLHALDRPLVLPAPFPAEHPEPRSRSR